MKYVTLRRLTLRGVGKFNLRKSRIFGYKQRPETTLPPLFLFWVLPPLRRRRFRKRKGGRDGGLRAVGLIENPKAGSWIRGVPWFRIV